MKVERRPVQANSHPAALIHRAGAGRVAPLTRPDRQSSNQLARNIANEPRVVMIGVNLACLPDLGDFAVSMLFVPFNHSQPDSQREQQQHVA